jgi:hypothetical protein
VWRETGETGHDSRPVDPRWSADLTATCVRAGRDRRMLSMVMPVDVVIVGAPVACTDGVKDAWRELAGLAATQLEQRFGDQVRVTYHDLFDPDCPSLPPDAALPVVFVAGEVLSSGGKLSVPLIRQAVETCGAAPIRSVSA